MKSELTNKEHLAHVVRKLRTEKGYTQQQLAELCNCSVVTIHKTEAGKTQPSFRVFSALMDVLAAESLIGYFSMLEMGVITHDYNERD